MDTTKTRPAEATTRAAQHVLQWSREGLDRRPMDAVAWLWRTAGGCGLCGVRETVDGTKQHYRRVVKWNRKWTY